MPTHTKVGWYNVQDGHPAAAHAQMILRRFEDEHLDALALSEMHDYNHHVVKLAKEAGHRLVYKTTAKHPAGDNVAILVRKGVKVGRHWSFKAGTPYHAPGGGLRRAQHMLVCEVDDIPVCTVHAPVHAWTTTKRGRIWGGPLLRRIAYRRFVKRLRSFARRHPGPLILPGDWNANPTTDGAYSPDWLRREIGGQFARPHQSTGHGEIDFAIVRGLHVTDCRVLPNPKGLPHSDHRLVVATLTKEDQ